jgi:LacI family transcriptional regulator
MVTIYDIAKKANVSAMTVSKVINNAGRISEKTREKVRLVMEELNYVPNQMARSLVLQQTKILFLLITDITNSFYTTLARGAEDAAKQHGYRLLFGNSDESLMKEGEYIETILGTRAQQAYQFGFMGVQLLIERIMERETAKPWEKSFSP